MVFLFLHIRHQSKVSLVKDLLSDPYLAMSCKRAATLRPLFLVLKPSVSAIPPLRNATLSLCSISLEVFSLSFRKFPYGPALICGFHPASVLCTFVFSFYTNILHALSPDTSWSPDQWKTEHTIVSSLLVSPVSGNSSDATIFLPLL
jgi:hypothetical protein